MSNLLPKLLKVETMTNGMLELPVNIDDNAALYSKSVKRQNQRVNKNKTTNSLPKISLAENVIIVVRQATKRQIVLNLKTGKIIKDRQTQQ